MEELKIPKPEKKQRKKIIHNDILKDDYHWMKKKESKEVLEYIRKENDYTDAMMEPSIPIQKKIYKEIVERMYEDDNEIPYKKKSYYYYKYTKKGKQYPIHVRKKNNGLPRIILDINKMAYGNKFYSVLIKGISPDENILAFTVDNTGFRDYKLHLKDLKTNKVRKFSDKTIRSFAWAEKNSFFFTTEDKAKRPSKVWFYDLQKDQIFLIYEEKDKKFSVYVYLSSDNETIFINSESSLTTEVRYLKNNGGKNNLQLFSKRKTGVKYYLESLKNNFYCLTNDDGNNFSLIFFENPQKKSVYKKIIPHDPKIMLEDFEIYKKGLILNIRKEGFPSIWYYDFKEKKIFELKIPQKVCNIRPDVTLDFESKIYRFKYDSYTYPTSTFSFNFLSKKIRLLKKTKIKKFKEKNYNTRVMYAETPDGILIPISMCYHKKITDFTDKPFLLTGYGSYGYSNDPYFSSSRLSLIDRGVIFATAHVRGGGEMGKVWHDDGRLLKKRNTFLDFICCSEFLIKKKITSKNKLVISGGSAGGLLIGSVLNMKPHLFKAAVLDVPFVDVINTMLDESLPLTIGEYEEWGDPNRKEYYSKMMSYSPYDNIKKKKYPLILVKSAFYDSQVMYWEPLKYVAKLREKKTDKNVLLLKMNMESGHGGASGRYSFIGEIAFTYAFILGALGIIK